MEPNTPFENEASGVVGIYRLNALFVRMTSLYDLDPSEGEPPSAAVAFHAHEYIHFLHNVSTIAGQTYLEANLALLRGMTGNSDSRGHFLGIEGTSGVDLELLQLAPAVMGSMLGTSGAVLNSCVDSEQWECSPSEAIVRDDIPSVGTTFKAKTVSGEVLQQQVIIGLSFVTEGIAYEVEREIRRLQGTPDTLLDANTRVFPYIAFRVLLKSWTGRDLSAQDRIGIGIASLSSEFAGIGLKEICYVLRKYPELPVIEVLRRKLAGSSGTSDGLRAKFRMQRDDIFPGDSLWTAMGEYIALVERGSQLRRQRWAPELELLSRPWTPEELKIWIGSTLDCLLMQEKPDGELRIFWHGPGTMRQTAKHQQRMAILQSALHYSQLHIRTDGSLVPTSALAGKSVRCPFAGGCEVQRDEQYPRDCLVSPWMRAKPGPLGTKACFYAVGVMTVRKNDSSQDPIVHTHSLIGAWYQQYARETYRDGITGISTIPGRMKKLMILRFHSAL